MERVVRYTSLARAWEVGDLISNAYPPEFLTGLNFIVELEGSVIVAAVFEDKLISANPVIINIYMLPGEVLKVSLDDLITPRSPGRLLFLGDGLPPFTAYCESLGVKGPGR